MRRLTSALLALSVGLTSVGASAQARDSAAAEALFDEARRLAEEGRYAEACPKFAESNRLDPGVGVLLYLGACHERLGRVASAWAAFREARAAAEAQGRADKAATATERIGALEPRLPRLRIVVPPDSSIDGIEVLRDDVLLGEAMWGTPVPVDPGVHAIVARAAGYEPWEGSLEAKEGQLTTVEIPPLQLARLSTDEPAVSPGARAPGAPRASASSPAAGFDDPGAPQRTAAVVAWGVGGASMVLGAVFGVVASSQWADAQEHCREGTPLRCDREGLDGIESTESSGLASTVFVLAGSAVVVAGAILWVTAPAGDGGSAALGIDARGVRAFGSF